MNACERHTVDLMLYLDDELVDGKLMEFSRTPENLRRFAGQRSKNNLRSSSILRAIPVRYIPAPPKASRTCGGHPPPSAGATTASKELYEGQWAMADEDLAWC